VGASIDISKAHLTRQHGDILVIFSWVNDERAMILLPAYRHKAPWYIVLESAAYKYDDVRYLARQCPVACNVLGIEPSTANWSRIGSIINEGLPDLIRMPTEPAKEFHKTSFGELMLKADGNIVASESIKLEKDGASYG